ncbi:hypothetical protein MTR67_035712 [Solanum verrucosum]|uniref:Uncharacterized protein n=1 Tax=Solanum verrucosum TaxID=315347 RepID=A0AAF0UAE1_SOLVR|nr:hypothetical protein MTR67_035712 [Solanum verrucosum]
MAFRKSGDFSYNDSTGVVSAYRSHVGSITRHKFKKSGLDGSEYFTSLETIRNNNSHTMVVTSTPRGNLASVFFGESSQIGSNFGESEDSMDSPTSMNVNALMADSTDMNEKFAMMEQTLKTLKKFVDDKNLHIAQLMNKLEAFTPGELSHVPTCPPGFDQQNKDIEESLTKSLTPTEVDFPMKTLEGSLEIDDHEENEVDGKIRVGLPIGDVKSNTLIHVIDAKISYHLLLGHPWVHENRVVPSTLHQYMKYMKDCEVVKIDVDINLFTKTESYFAYAKFYLDSGRSNMEAHVKADSIDLEDCKVQWVGIKMSKKRMEEVSIKLSPSKVVMQTNIDNE